MAACTALQPIPHCSPGGNCAKGEAATGVGTVGSVVCRLANMGWLELCHYYPDWRQEAATHYLIVIIRVEGNEVSPTPTQGLFI